MGATIAHFARAFGIHHTTVLAQLRRNGAQPRSGVVERNIEEAGATYEQGWSLAKIGERLDVDGETVRQALRKAA